MTLTEKAAYLRGLADGLGLDPEKAETKMFNAIMDVIDDLALTASDTEDDLAVLNEQLDAVDEDLDEVFLTKMTTTMTTTFLRLSARRAAKSYMSTAISLRRTA